MRQILFVCMGNICRSPTLEIVARAEFARANVRAQVESAATHAYHIGEPADARAVECARAAGYDLSSHRAQRATPALLARFDTVLAMDETNLRDLARIAPACAAQLVLPFCGLAAPREMPDPYYGGARDFAHVLELARRGIAALIESGSLAHNRRMETKGT